MSIANPAGAGPLRAANQRTDPQVTLLPLARAFLEVSAEVRNQSLLDRATWFYRLVGGALTVGLLGTGTGLVLLGDSWWQRLVAAAMGILLTKVAFVAHEAGHRQILRSGPGNDRLARLLAAGVVGISYSWWDSKHSRHHGNPNRIGKDPDIEMGHDHIPRGRRGQHHRDGPVHRPPIRLAVPPPPHLRGAQPALPRYSAPRSAWARTGTLDRTLPDRRPVHSRARAAVRVLPVGIALAFLAFLAVQMAVFGVYRGASFAPNHKGMPIIERDARLDFFSKQVRTSRNIPEAGGQRA